MKVILKKMVCIGIMVMLLCSLAACGDGTKEHIKTGEERALEFQEDAKESVSEYNDDVMKVTETEKVLELE